MKLFYVALFTLCMNCALLTGAQSPSTEKVLKLLGQVILVQDNICAAVASEKNDQQLATFCSIAYSGERAGLLAAASFLEAGDEEDAICAVLDVVKGVKQVNDMLLSRGVEEPALVKQALAIGDALQGMCPAGK